MTSSAVRGAALVLCSLVVLSGILLMPPVASRLAGDLHWTSRAILWTSALPLTLLGLALVSCVLLVEGGIGGAARRAARSFPRSAAVAAGFALAVPIIGLAEFIFYLRDAGVPGPVVITKDGESHFIDDPLLGYAVAPGSRMTSLKEIDGVVVYDVVYSIDEKGRRITPSSGDETSREVVVFFGCSNTFGEGVRDDETLPHYVGRLLPDRAILNYAFRGYGPQQMLAMIEDGRLDSALEGKSVTAIYLLIDAHVQRAIGSMAVVTTWGVDMPRYVLDVSGEPRLEGSFRSSRPFVNWLYALASKSNILSHYRVELPPSTDEHFRLTAGIVEAAARRIAGIAAESRFHLVLHPTVSTGVGLVPHLGDSGVDVLDYRGLWASNDTNYMIDGDWHPTPLAHRTLAERIVRDALDASP